MTKRRPSPIDDIIRYRLAEFGGDEGWVPSLTLMLGHMEYRRDVFDEYIREVEKAGLVEGRPDPDGSPWRQYRLTELGRAELGEPGPVVKVPRWPGY